MPLTEDQIAILHEAIGGYAFPAVYYDFRLNQEIRANTMAEVEQIICGQLRSAHTEDVRHGLANILYWGYANVGYRDTRVEDLNIKITVRQTEAFQALLENGRVPTMGKIKRIHIPQYSGMSFVSKVLMFLNPTEYCVLDKQIASLRTYNAPKALNRLVFGPKETQIRISAPNEAVYDEWREECLTVSAEYYRNEYRAVDIERGLFNLIQQGRLSDAQVIYNDA